MHGIWYGYVSNCYNEMVIKFSCTHNVRNSLTFCVPSICKNVYIKSALVNGIFVWNNLNVHIREISNRALFKKRLKEILLLECED
jgi:hypothetical protein